MNGGSSRRSLLRTALAGATFLCCQPFEAVARPSPTRLTLRRGLNTWPWFSLTREYPAPRIDYAWPVFQQTRPVPTPADLRHLKASGLDFIRLPVDPGPFLSAQKPERDLLVRMLTDAVQAAIDAGLSVIVNIQANGATHYWNPDRMISGMDAPAFDGYRGLVGEIATHLGAFPADRVGLEPVNEPPQACSSEVWTDIQRSLLETARNAAPDLTLVATGGCGSMVSGLAALDPTPLAGLEPLLFTFHFYEPYLFSHQGAPWMREPVYRSLNAVPWPASAGSLEQTLKAVRDRMATDVGLSEEDKKVAYDETVKVLKVYFDAQPDRPFIDRYLDMVSAWCRQYAIPPQHVFMGEFGALRTDSKYVAAPSADRARYIRDVRSSAEAHGFPWAFWNMFDGMGVVDDVTRAFDPAIVDALGLAMPDIEK